MCIYHLKWLELLQLNGNARAVLVFAACCSLNNNL